MKVNVEYWLTPSYLKWVPLEDLLRWRLCRQLFCYVKGVAWNLFSSSFRSLNLCSMKDAAQCFCDFSCLHHPELCEIRGGRLLMANSCCGMKWFSQPRFLVGHQTKDSDLVEKLAHWIHHVDRTAVSTLAWVLLWLGHPDNIYAYLWFNCIMQL